jgi:hypothetical protein
MADGVLHARKDGVSASLRPEAGALIYEDDAVKAILNSETLEVKAVEFKGEPSGSIMLTDAVQMGVLWRSLKDFYLFK